MQKDVSFGWTPDVTLFVTTDWTLYDPDAWWRSLKERWENRRNTR